MGTFYLKQLLVGREVGRGDRIGSQMQNFVYLVGDRDAGECLVIDPAWDVDGIIATAQADDMKIVGALATHYHPDHVGGSLFGFSVQGLSALLEKNPCRVHAHKLEADGIRVVTSLSKSDIAEHDSGDAISVGDVEVTLLHTPGHTPGSSCFRVKEALLAGDTLFLQGCGRVDLPGGDADEMERTLAPAPGHASGRHRAVPGPRLRRGARAPGRGAPHQPGVSARPAGSQGSARLSCPIREEDLW